MCLASAGSARDPRKSLLVNEALEAVEIGRKQTCKIPTTCLRLPSSMIPLVKGNLRDRRRCSGGGSVVRWSCLHSQSRAAR